MKSCLSASAVALSGVQPFLRTRIGPIASCRPFATRHFSSHASSAVEATQQHTSTGSEEDNEEKPKRKWGVLLYSIIPMLGYWSWNKREQAAHLRANRIISAYDVEIDELLDDLSLSEGAVAAVFHRAVARDSWTPDEFTALMREVRPHAYMSYDLLCMLRYSPGSGADPLAYYAHYDNAQFGKTATRELETVELLTALSLVMETGQAEERLRIPFMLHAKRNTKTISYDECVSMMVRLVRTGHVSLRSIVRRVSYVPPSFRYATPHQLVDAIFQQLCKSKSDAVTLEELQSAAKVLANKRMTPLRVWYLRKGANRTAASAVTPAAVTPPAAAPTTPVATPEDQPNERKQ